MNEFKEFLTSSEMIIVGVIAAIGCFLGLIVYIFDKTYYKRKQRHNTKDVEKEMAKEEIKEVPVTAINNDLASKPKVTTIEEALSVAESIEPPTPVEVREPVLDIKEEVSTIEEDSNTTTSEVVDVIDDNFVEEEIIEPVEEKPLVIPIEEYESSKSIEDIFTEVKEKVESLDSAPAQEEQLKYTDIEPNKDEAIAELKKATENLIKKEEEKELAPENIELTKFEEEQEENAIISMDELLRKSNELYEKNEVTQYEDEGNEPISLQDLELRMNNIKSEMMAIEDEDQKEVDSIIPIEDNSQIYNLKQPEVAIKTPKVVLDDFNTIDKSDNIYRDDIVFKSSPIISPIFGIEDNMSSNDMMFENTANYDKFDAEIKKTNEFIVTLKELQEKLD